MLLNWGNMGLANAGGLLAASLVAGPGASTLDLICAGLVAAVVSELGGMPIFALYDLIDGNGIGPVVWMAKSTIRALPVMASLGVIGGLVSAQPAGLPFLAGPLGLLIWASRANVVAYDNRSRLDGLLSAATAVNAATSLEAVEEHLIEASRSLLFLSTARIAPVPPGESAHGAAIEIAGQEERWLVAGARDTDQRPWSEGDQRLLESLASLGATAMERAMLHQAAEEQATHDALTGLLNRRAFHAAVEEEVARAPRHGRGLALLFIDLDGFKVINDERGHEAGDQVLVATASRIREVLRTTDSAARLGGDEFTVLLRYAASCDEAGRAAGRVADALRPRIDIGEGLTAAVTPSIGLAIWQERMDAEELIRAADAAMYEAKRAGKNRWVLHAAQ